VRTGRAVGAPPRSMGLGRFLHASPPWARWSAVLVLSTVAMGAVNFAFGLVVARLGGERTWSAVAPLLAAGTAGTFAGLGLEYAVTRATMRGERWTRILRRITPLGSILVVAVALSWSLATPVARFLHLSNAAPVPLSVALFAASVVAAAPSGLLVGQKRIGALSAAGVAAAFLRIAMLWVLPGTLVVRALTCSIASVVVGALVMLILAARRAEPSVEGADGFARTAATGSVARLALWITVVAPVVVARHFLPLPAAGELATVSFVASSLAYLAAPVATAFFPVMLVDRDRRHLRNGLAVSLGLVVAGTAVLVAIGPLLLRLIYHTTQPDLSALLLFGCVGVLFQTASGFLVWAALARNNAVGSVYAGALGSLPLVGLLLIFHSSPAALLVAALPSMAVIGILAQVGRIRPRRRPPSAATGARPAVVGRAGPRTLGASEPLSLSACSVGVMAHDEERTIERCLQSLLDARDPAGGALYEVVVVVSGGDRTESLARQVAARNARVRVSRQAGARGKSAAINQFLRQARKELLVVSSADVLLGEGKLAELVAPLADPRVGMCGGAVLPTNPRTGLCNRLVHLTWEMHSAVAAVRPKLGEIVAFRRCFSQIDEVSSVDEVSLEEEVTKAGLALHYVPNVLVYNHGPTRIRDFLRHRYRINRGHIAVRARSGYTPATSSLPLVVRRAATLVARRPTAIPLLSLAAAIEILTRVAARSAQLTTGIPASGRFHRIDSAKVELGLPDTASGAELAS
jgi:biofilm PGA synthesis N-glycosyltransferase PgaC